jgi:hypothetical protein
MELKAAPPALAGFDEFPARRSSSTLIGFDPYRVGAAVHRAAATRDTSGDGVYGDDRNGSARLRQVIWM